ncbi:MAG: methyltransferase domain-containing protein [Thermoanaerobaculia bacterium]|nr:methyltransferase domain-containing protein [Thermoanaerobaculia bacterium]
MAFDATRWNRIRYTIWAPVYDLVARRLDRGRRRAHELVEVKPGERVLLDGAGTGLDLEYLPHTARIAAIDITPSMIARLRARAESLGMTVDAEVGDGHRLPFPDASFDVVILHLILAVIPDPVACILEAERVLRPGGRVSILDKFVPDGQRPSLVRRLANLVTAPLASHITRSLGPILASTSLQRVRDEHAAFGGLFRAVVAEKQVNGQGA